MPVKKKKSTAKSAKSKQPASKMKPTAGKRRKNVPNGNAVMNGVNNNIQNSLEMTPTLKHPVPLVNKRIKYIGPVIRVSKSVNGSGLGADDGSFSLQYAIINKFSPKQEQQDAKSKQTRNGNQLQHQTSTSRNKMGNDLFHKASSESGIVDWKCSFCHHPPHVCFLGDLYGPYFREADQQNGVGFPESQEAWVHEDCAVWASNVFILNGKLMNLQSALNESANSRCVHCSLPGATMACFTRNCKYRTLHFPCASKLGFHLDESRFVALCPTHNAPGASRSVLWELN